MPDQPQEPRLALVSRDPAWNAHRRIEIKSQLCRVNDAWADAYPEARHRFAEEHREELVDLLSIGQ